MAKLVTSDGVQINLFLDLNSHNTGEGTLLYGPKSQAEMDFIVKGFRNFKTNTEYNDKNRLEFHCDHLISISISTLMSANPTSSSQYTVPEHSDTKLYFVGNDLVLSKTGTKIHRIDLFKSASTNDVLTVNGSSPDASGNVTVTVGNDHSTEISNLTTRVTTLENTGGGGGGFTNQKVFRASENWTVPEGVDKVKIFVTGGGSAASYNMSTDSAYQAHSGSTSIGVFSVTGGVSILTITIGAGADYDVNPTLSSTKEKKGGYSSVSISTATGELKSQGGISALYESSYNTLSSVIGDVIFINSVRGHNFKGQINGSVTISGATGYWGSGEPVVGVGSQDSNGNGGYGYGATLDGYHSTYAGDGIVVVEY